MSNNKNTAEMNNSNGLIVGVVMVLVFVAGFALGYFIAPSEPVDDNQEVLMETESSGDSETFKSDTAAPSSESTVSQEGTTLDASAMTDGQRKLLESLGVDADSITLTPEMVACAEAKLGNERMSAIQNGDTPSFFEGTKLMTCYTAG